MADRPSVVSRYSQARPMALFFQALRPGLLDLLNLASHPTANRAISMPASRTLLTGPLLTTRRGVLLATVAMTSAPVTASLRETAPPLLHAAGRYFATPGGKPVFLAGNHSWGDLQTMTIALGGTDGSVTPGTYTLDFAGFCAWAAAQSYNFIRLWTDCVYAPQNRTVSPQPWTLNNGKYDLNTFDQSYFDRALSYAQTAAQHGIYVSFMLFCAGSYTNPTNWTRYSPFGTGNNSTGIDGDPAGTGNGISCIIDAIAAVKSIQHAYIEKLCDTLAWQTNVLFEVCNEAEDTTPQWHWQIDKMNHLRSYAASKGYPAWPVGLTAAWQVGVDSNSVNSTLFGTSADWVSPSGVSNKQYMTSSSAPPGNKVVVPDTDHIYGVGGDERWAWIMFMAGNGGVLYMDNFDGIPVTGCGWSTGDQAIEVQGRLGMSQVRQVCALVDLTGTNLAAQPVQLRLLPREPQHRDLHHLCAERRERDR